MSVKLSASSVKQLTTCSWVYYCEKVLKLKGPTHPKTILGTCIHHFFEILTNKKHAKYVELLSSMDNPTILAIPQLKRLAFFILRHNGLDIEEWINDFDNLAVVGLLDDFYQSDSEYQSNPEYEFHITGSNYICHGFIDKYVIEKPTPEYPVGKVRIIDYKTQKDKFTDEQLSFNLQALIYQLAIWTELGIPADVEFKLLRHKESQIVKWQGEKALLGLQIYLSDVAQYLSNFDIKKASNNLAKFNKKNSWLCGMRCQYPGQLKKDGTPYFYCHYRFPFTYYAKYDSENNVLKTSKNVLELLNNCSKGEFVREHHYKGCYAFFAENYE